VVALGKVSGPPTLDETIALLERSIVNYRSMSYVDDPKWRRSALNDDTVSFKDPRRAMSPTTWNDSILSPRVMSPRRETTTVTTDSHGDVVETKCLRDAHGDQIVSRTVTDRFGDSRRRQLQVM